MKEAGMLKMVQSAFKLIKSKVRISTPKIEVS
jgi:hypothetical protein